MNKKVICCGILCAVLNPCNPIAAAERPLHPCEVIIPSPSSQLHPSLLDRRGFLIDTNTMEIDISTKKNAAQLYLALSHQKNRPSKPTYDGRSFETVVGIFPNRETWIKNFTPRDDVKDRNPNSFLCPAQYVKFNPTENCYEIGETTGANIKFKILTETIRLTESPSKNEANIPIDKSTGYPTENCFLLTKRDHDHYTSGLYFVTEEVVGISQFQLATSSFLYKGRQFIPLNKGYAITYELYDGNLESFIITQEAFDSGLIKLDKTTGQPTHKCYIHIKKGPDLYTIVFE